MPTSITPNRSAGTSLLALGAFLIIVFLVYRPGLEGLFIFDDYSNIVANPGVQIDDLSLHSLWSATLSGESGPLKRPLSMLSFAINHYASGLSPYTFKLTNLLLHLINGTGVYFLTLLILKGYRASAGKELGDSSIYLTSLVVAALWLAHPLNLTSVLYVVQRMASLSAGFTILALCLFVAGRLRMIDDTGGATLLLLGALVAMLLSTLAKENGLLFPLFAFVIEITIFRFRSGPHHRGRRLTIIFFALTLAIPAAVALLYIGTHTEWITNGYAGRNFSLTERLLTEARALWFYLSLIIYPSNSRLGLYHDDFAISHGLLDPSTTLLSLVGIAIAIGIALRTTRRMPLVSFAILFFFAGHLMESTVFSLELVHEHRNYLPDYGPLFLAGYLLTSPLASRKMRLVSRSAAGLFIVGLLGVTALRAEYWADPLEHSLHEAYNHPNSPRAASTLGETYGKLAALSEDKQERYYPLAVSTLLHAASLRDNFTDPYFKLIVICTKLGQPIEAAWVDELAERLSDQPVMASAINLTEWIAQAERDGRYSVDPEIMVRIIRSTLDNPTLGGRNRAEFLTAASKYFWQNRGDYESALYLIATAADSLPSRPKYRLHLVTLLIAMNRYSDAQEELKRVVELDHLGIFHRDIRRYQTLINEHVQTGRSKADGTTG